MGFNVPYMKAALDFSGPAEFVLVNLIFVNALAYLLWFFALEHLKASSVSMLSLLTPIAGGVSALLLLDEVHNNLEKICYFLILLGIFLLLFYKKQELN